MEKPVSLIIEDAKNEIVNTINNQKINPSIMVYIVKEIYEAMITAKESEMQNDKSRWDEYLKSEKDEG